MSSASKIIVRRIRKKDFAQYLRVLKVSFSEEIEIVGLDLRRLLSIIRFYNLIDLASRVLDTLNIYLPTILVAISEDDMIVGGVHIAPFGNSVWTIDSLVVDPNYRRSGIGVRLISEAIKYVWNGRGERALTYVRADNLPSMKIRKRLRGEFFDKRVLLLSELNKALDIDAKDDFLIREVKSKDLLQIFNLCRELDFKKATEFRITSRAFLNSPLEHLLGKLGLASSKRLVLEAKGRVVGYIHFTYASPKEAAKIESFYIAGPSDLYHRTTLLLGRVFGALQERNIKKVTISVSEDWKEMIQILENVDFKPIASFYGIAHNLA